VAAGEDQLEPFVLDRRVVGLVVEVVHRSLGQQ
jgi:hypothetical protein